ncbi:MAG: DUF3106 domain-containing protein [Sterolibacterium sp.]
MARTFSAIIVGITLTFALALSSPANAAVLSPLKQPSWTELSPQQREILAPLANEWDKLEYYRRKKWLGIAQRYPAMSAEEQRRLQLNMKTWVNLSPEERKLAREKYKALKKAPPEQRQTVTQKWLEYKNLPEEEKERLKKILIRKLQPKRGAGKPAKLAPVPAAITVNPVVPATPAMPTSPSPPAVAPATQPQQ